MLNLNERRLLSWQLKFKLQSQDLGVRQQRISYRHNTICQVKSFLDPVTMVDVYIDVEDALMNLWKNKFQIYAKILEIFKFNNNAYVHNFKNKSGMNLLFTVFKN